MLLDIAKQNNYSNDEIKKVFFTDVISVNVYQNIQTHLDNATIYCVYADYIETDNTHESTAKFYFLVSNEKFFNTTLHNEVFYLYAISQH